MLDGHCCQLHQTMCIRPNYKNTERLEAHLNNHFKDEARLKKLREDLTRISQKYEIKHIQKDLDRNLENLTDTQKFSICDFIGEHHFSHYYLCINPHYCENQQDFGGYKFCNVKIAITNKL